MTKDKKLPYVILYITNSHEYVIWPYLEAQEFTIYDIPKSSCIYLNDNEVKQIENLLDELQKERK